MPATARARTRIWLDASRLTFAQALRGLATRPRFTLIVLATFGIAIGATTALFTMVHALLLRPLPFPDPDRIVQIERPPVEFGADGFRVISEMTEHPRLRAVSLYVTGAGGNIDDDAGPARIGITQVDAAFFDVFGMPPLLGRTFVAEEVRRGGNRVLVLTERLWRTRFGGDIDVIGRTVRINGNSFAVVGVMADELRLPEGTEAWVPLPVIGELYTGVYAPDVIARVEPTASRAEANEAVRATMREAYAVRGVAADEDRLPRLVGLQDGLTSGARTPLLILFGATALLLLAACTNIAGLLLSRVLGRRHELAVQRALGASRARVAGGPLAEAILLAGAGGLAGVLLAWWSADLLLALAPAGILPDAGISRGAATFLFSAATVIGCAVACGALPALRSAGVVPSDVLRSGGIARGFAPGRLQSVLVAMQIATACVVVASASLLVRSYARAHAVPLGIEPEGTLTFRLQLPLTTYGEGERIRALVDDFETRMDGLPGVVAVGATSHMPLTDQMGVGVRIELEGETPSTGDQPLYSAVTPGYFRAMGIPVQRGRTFERGDDTPGTAGYVVNEVFVRQRFAGENPIGRRITLHTLFGESREGQIVGVVGNVRHRGAGSEIDEQLFEPFQRAPTRWIHFAIRTREEPSALMESARTVLAGLDPAIAPFGIRTLEDAVATSLRARRFTMQLLALFATVTLLLSMLGLYGTIAQTVEAGRREIGVRMTLGADARRVVALVLSRAVRIAGPGLALGLLLSFAAARWTSSMLFGIEADDPLTWSLVASCIGLAVLAAAWIPAMRAARLDPAETLRGD